MCETHATLLGRRRSHDQRREMAGPLCKSGEISQTPAKSRDKVLYVYNGFRDYDRALAELKLAKQLLPNEARIYMLTGAVDRRTARFAEAEVNFRRAVELDPRNFVVVLEAASTFQGMRRYSESKALFEKGLAISPNDAFASFLHGYSVFAQTGDANVWRVPLDRVAHQGPEAARAVAYPLLVCSWMQRNKSEAEKAVALIPAGGIANSFDGLLFRANIASDARPLFGDKNKRSRRHRRASHLRQYDPRAAGLREAGLSRPDGRHARPARRRHSGRKRACESCP